MESELGIGEFASRVGLTVSALRFYDDAVVLKPARGSASEAIRLLDSTEDAMKTTCTVDGAELRAALTQLLHATPGPEVTRVPDGVQLEIHHDALRLVATDGHRLAIRDLVAEGSGEASAVLAAPPIRTSLANLALGTQKVELIDGQCLIGGVEHSVLHVDFPDYEKILPGHRPALRASFELGGLRSSLQEGEEVTTLRFEPGSVAIGFNRDYLLRALEATRGPDVLMESDGPESPCLIRSADRGGLIYLLMPIRLLDPA